MPKGSPNDKSKLLNFVAKVFDPIDKQYKPVYEAPDATNLVYGDVLLSDATDSDLNAATGVTAATPAAVKAVQDDANNKLDKVSTDAQTVAGPVTFEDRVSGTGGFTGELTGNASTATRLRNGRMITVQGGANGTPASATFDGSANISLTLSTLDATAVTGILPLSTIPKAAVENMTSVANEAARLALTNEQVQNGDTVFQADTGVMYLVVDDTQLASAAGYQEYQAGTAAKLGTSDVGSGTQPMYLSAGVATASTETVGAGNRPIYMNAGTLAVGTYELNKTVPSNALFTDTTYDVFDPATTSAAGSTGLVPAPAANDNLKFLRGDGTWQVAGEVTGVKGNSETDYRVGNVNLTSADIGSLDLTGGTMEGSIVPSATNTYNLGEASHVWRQVYATSFVGALSGNATTATTATTANRLNKTVQLTGNITSNAISLNADGATTISTTIADRAVSLGKLADTVGTVYVGDTEPTDSHILIWVQP